jgi:hypothetical protein
MDCLLGAGIGLSAFFHKTNPVDALPRNNPIVVLQHLLKFHILLLLENIFIRKLFAIPEDEQKWCFSVRRQGIYSTELSTALFIRDRRTARSDRLLP